VNQRNKLPHSSHLKLLISEEDIQKKIAKVSQQLNAEYKGRELTIVMIMKGSICLVADLIRHLNIPFTLEFVQCASYGARGTQRGELTVFGIDQLDVNALDLLLVDDIFDSGHTLRSVAIELQKKHPRSLKTLVLLSKRTSGVEGFTPDHALFNIGEEFVVGYGLDYQEHYRGLPAVYVITEV
jgi:hypoxanthine phosphoribosyltransferase